MPLATPLTLPGAVPIALLPVRLETRFSTTAAGPCLQIRVYPDDIHRDSHETALTADEVLWGQNFWRDTWCAGLAAPADPGYAQRLARELGAWKQLASTFGVQRGEHIARALAPTNPAARPPAPSDGPLAVEPAWPAFEPRLSSWTRAARARCLPDRWVAIGEVAGQPAIVAEGAAIAGDPSVGPNPSAPAPAPGVPAGSAPPVDPDMRWMVDFETALTQGMAIRMPLSPQVAQSGLDRLLVIGVRQPPPNGAAAGSEALKSLFQAHRHTWGLALVAPGTPTNNSEDGASGYVRDDPGYQTSFDLRSQAAPAPEDDGSRLATALGLPADTFARLTGARELSQAGERAINRALWPATVGYAVEQMFDGLLPDADPLLWAEHFDGRVRAQGPLPAVRVGRQPYGVLPVTALDGWGAGAPALLPLLKALREVWRRALSQLPHSGRDPASVGRDLVEALGQQPRGCAWTWRYSRGPVFTTNFFQIGDAPLAANDLANDVQNGAALVQAVLAQVGLQPAQAPRLATITHADIAEPQEAPLVQAEGPSRAQPLADNYIQRLANPALSLLDLHDEAATFWPNPAQPKPMLWRLLRHATLLAYARQALDDSLIEPVPPFGPLRRDAPWFEPEFIDGLLEVAPRDGGTGRATTPTFWRVLRSPMVDPRTPTQVILRGDYLRQTATGAAATPLGRHLASLDTLAALPVASLERLAAGSLDLASHRLDAWITSLATYQLERCRTLPAAANVLAVGGYGWVENLRPRPPGQPLSDGYVHAPSIGHANAAAVLRSGYLAHRDQTLGARLEVDLSSSRVRTALALVDGVRQGQPLGALLGYRLEKRLHERALETAIGPLRELAPLVVDPAKPRAQREPLEAVAANNVVDGLRLLQRYGGADEPDLLAAVPNRAAVEDELDALQNAVDAIGDLGLAEGVYQAAQGNYARAAATLDAVSRGEAPVEFEVVRTPTSGTALTQRVALVLDPATPADPTAWNPARPRAVAEPALEAWAAGLLGSPTRIKFAVSSVRPDTDTTVVTYSLAQLEPRPCALDLVFAVPVTEPPAQTELELRLLRLAAKVDPPVRAAGTELRLSYGRDAFGGSEADLTVPEFFVLVRTVRDLIVNARPLDARDLEAAGQAPARGIALPVLLQRYRDTFELWRSALALLVANRYLTRGTDALLAALEVMTGFAVPHAAPAQPLAPSSAARADLMGQAERTLAQCLAMSQRLPVGRPENLSAAELLAGLKVLLGEAFTVAVPFTPAAGSAYAEALNRRIAAGDAERAQTAAWLGTTATVRPGVARLRDVQVLAEGVDAAALPIRVAQLPLSAAAWNAWPADAGTGSTSIVAMLPFAPALPQPPAPPPPPLVLPALLAGLMVDEWTEVLPHPVTRTGLTLQYETPSASAPQAMLLALAPDITVPWTLQTLATIVGETLDLAKLRLVDHDSLPLLGHFLPAIYLANNVGGDLAGDTVSTRFNN